MEEKKIWKKEEIKEMLMNNDRAVVRGVVVIYSLQTADEKSLSQTTQHNGVGYNGMDAKFMSSLAQQILEKGGLSQKQLVYARKKIVKYAGQLTKVANGKLKVTV